MSFMRLSKQVSGWMAITAAVGFGVVSAAGTQGCTITTDVGDAGDFDANFDTDSGITYDAGADTNVPYNACNDCTYTQCTGQTTLCFQDTGCQAIYACATRVGCDSDCVTACYNAGSDSAQRLYYAFASCDQSAECGDKTNGVASGACATACATPATSCPDPVDAGPTDDAAVVDASTPATCDQCVSASCATQKAACASGSECDLYTQCLGACTDAACITTCGTAHAQGQTDATALGSCTTTNCSTACGL